MDRGTWRATSHGVAKSQTQLSDSAAAETGNCICLLRGDDPCDLRGWGAASEDIDVRLIKKFLRVFHELAWRNLNELFVQPNVYCPILYVPTLTNYEILLLLLLLLVLLCLLYQNSRPGLRS